MTFALEEDYETWMMIAVNSVDDVFQFAAFLPEFARLLDSIRESGTLPAPFQGNTDDFISKMKVNIIPNILTWDVLPDISLLGQFFAAFINWGAYGITNKNAQIIDTFYIILNYSLSVIYTVDESEFSYAGVKAVCVSHGVLDACLVTLAEGVKDIDMLDHIHRIGACLVSEDGFWNLASATGTALLALIEADKRASTSKLITIIDSVLDEARIADPVPEYFCKPWMQICVVLIKSDIFEKQLAGMRTMSGLMSDQSTSNLTKAWFQEDPERLNFFTEFKTIHPELCLPMAEVLEQLAEFELLPFDVLSELWKLHAVQHASAIDKFYIMFSMVARSLHSNWVPRLVEMCMNPVEKSEAWYKFIGALGTALASRDECLVSFKKVRDFIYEEAIGGNAWARAELTNIIGRNLDDADFRKFVAVFMKYIDEDFGTTALASIVGNHQSPDDDLIQEILNAAITSMATQADVSNTLKLIDNLCMYNQESLNSEQTKRIYELGKHCDVFTQNLACCFSMKLIDFETLMTLLINEPDVDLNTAKITRLTVFGANGYRVPVRVPVLPFIGEDFLWNMVLRETKQRHNLTTLLITIYALNDGTSLTDYFMITYFVQKWSKIFATTENKKAMVDVLRSFIRDVEHSVDLDSFNVQRHLENKDVALKTITVTGKCLPSKLTFVLPEDTLFGVLRQKISKQSLLPRDSFNMKKGSVLVSENQQLKQFCEHQTSMSIVVAPLASVDRKLNLAHQRNMIPSVLLGQSGGETFELLMELLKDDSYSESVKRVLDYLPTSPLTKLQIEEISRKNSYDLAKFLPIEYPKLFQYNFEALSTAFDDNLKERFVQNGGFLYLVRSITKCRSMTLQIVQFLEKVVTTEVKNSMKTEIYETILPALCEYAVNEHEQEFKALVSFINELDVVEMDSALVKQAMKSLLGSEIFFVRSFSQAFFAKFPIPMESFVDMMDTIDERISAEFYGALLAHIDKPCDKLVEHIRNACERESVVLPSLLKILDKLLKNGWVSDNDQIAFTNYFISRFLTVDDQDKESELFDLAVKCIAQLQNQTLWDHLNWLHTNRSTYDSWNIRADSRPLSSTGHSGIDNLGATCFLNSTLQQFFAIAPLRNKIIEYSGTDAFMRELSQFFARLYLGKGQVLSASSLVREWTDWGGEPMDPMVQQDAFEFTQMLIDKLEAGLSKDVVQDLFGGNTVDVIEGLSQEYHHERNIPFCNITLPIAGSENMAQALEKFELPDFLTGDNQYQADGIGKIDAKKYSKLGKLPKYFIVQLGRFEYNYTTWVRTKINQEFEFPLVWDAAEYVSHPEGELTFHLTGVIVHTGTADFGHYTSYVKYGDKWLHFNDSAVGEENIEEIRKGWYGTGRSARSAYILVYTRADVLAVPTPEPEISDDLKDKIDRETQLMYDIRLFASESYFNLMVQLAAGSDKFSDIAMRYYFDTLPCTGFVKDALKIADPVCAQLEKSAPLKRHLLALVNSQYIECALAQCPAARVRRGAYDMIKCVDAKEVPLTVLRSLFGQPSSLIRYFRIWDEKYRLLEVIVANNEHARELAMTERWSLKIAGLLIKAAPEYYQSANPEKIDEVSFWKWTDLSGIFLLLSHLPIPPVFQNYLIGQGFIKNLLSGKTSIEAYVKLLNSLPPEVNATESVVSVIKDCTSVNYIRIGELLFNIFRSEAFAKKNELLSKVNGKPATNWDFACLLCHLVTFDDIRKLLIENTDKWLIPLLCDKAYQCRCVILYLLVRVVPHKIFDRMLPEWPTTPVMGPVNIALHDETDEMVTNAKLFLDIFIENIDVIVTLVKEAFAERETRQYGARYVAYHFIFIMRYFAAIVKRDISEEWIRMLRALIPYRMEYDEHILSILAGVNELHKQVDPDLALELFSYCACPSTQYNNIVKFLKEMAPHMNSSIVPLDECICGFLENCAFARANAVLEHYPVVVPYIVNFTKARPDLVWEWLSERLDELATFHLSGVVVILEALDKKLPVLAYLWHAAGTKQYLPLDSLVSLTCRFSSECEFDPVPLVSLLNSADLGSEGRKCLWEIIIEKKPSFSEFAKQYTWKGDQEYLVEYLLAVKSPESKTLLIEATQTSPGAFAKAYDFLKEIAASEFMDMSFITAVLSLDFHSCTDTIVRYIEEAFVAHPDGKDRILRPIISKLVMHAHFVQSILADACEITSDDTSPLYPLLDVVAKVPLCRESVIGDLRPLAESCQKSDTPEAQKLFTSLATCVK